MTFKPIHQHTCSIAEKVIGTPLGDLRLASSPSGLVGCWFVHDQRHAPDPAQVLQWSQVQTHPVLDLAERQMARYFEGTLRDFQVPLDLTWRGTDFQRQVWEALRTIPSGETTSYGQLAQRVGRPRAVRAVGAAVGRNPLSIVVPCHRVLGSDGSLTGYAGGIGRKKALLLLEGGVH